VSFLRVPPRIRIACHSANDREHETPSSRLVQVRYTSARTFARIPHGGRGNASLLCHAMYVLLFNVAGCSAPCLPERSLRDQSSSCSFAAAQPHPRLTPVARQCRSPSSATPPSRLTTNRRPIAPARRGGGKSWESSSIRRCKFSTSPSPAAVRKAS